MAIPKPGSTPKPLDVLQQMFNEVLVQTGKALKNASRDGKAFNPQSSVLVTTRFPASVEAFNAALDDIESEILRTKSVLQRDLNQLRASRRPPPVQPEKKTVAPTAPMHGPESPKMTMAPAPSEAPGSQFQPPSFQSPSRPGKQDNKPVAPFPNMGMPDLTVSPEAVPVPSPKITKAREPKSSPRTATIAGATGKPGGATPRKETKVYPPIPPGRAAAGATSATKGRATGPNAGGTTPLQSTTPIPVPTIPKLTTGSASSTPRTPASVTPVPIPLPPSVQAPVSAMAPVPIPAPNSAPAPAPGPAPLPGPALLSGPAPAPGPATMQGQPQAPAPPQPPVQPPGQAQPLPGPMPPSAPENIFTDMTFSLAPPSSSDGGQQAPGQMTQSHEMDLSAFGGGDMSSFSLGGFGNPGNGSGGGGGLTDVANMGLGSSMGDDTNMANVDAKIDGLFDLGSGDMDSMDLDYGLGNNAGDNSNFNDMYFGDGDDNMAGPDFDDTYFDL